MTMRIQLLQTVMGEAGALLASGSFQTVSDSFGAELVNRRAAVDLDDALGAAAANGPDYLTVHRSGNVRRPLDGFLPITYRAGARERYIGAGDSNTARIHQKTAATPTLSGVPGGNLATVSLTAHRRYPGDLVQIGNAADVAYNGVFVVETRTDANTFTYRTAIPITSASPAGTAECRIPSEFGNNGYFTYLNALLGGRLELVRNAGNVGERVAQLAARFDRDVLAYAPDHVGIMIGINDIRAGRTAAQVWPELEPLIDRAVAGVANVYLFTYFNHAAASASFTTGNTTELTALNALMRAKCAADTSGRLVLCDVFKALVDHGTATQPTAADYIEDSDIHLSPFGARVMAQVIAEAVRPRSRAVDLLAVAPQHAFGLTDGYLLDNPMLFPGTPQAALGTGASGVVAAGWRMEAVGGGSQTAVGAVVPRSVARDGDACGFNQRVTLTLAANNDGLQFRQTGLHTRMVAGGVYQGAVVIRASSLPANLKRLQLTINITADGVVLQAATGQGESTDGGARKLSYLEDVLVFTTPPVRIPPTAAAITAAEFFVFCQGAGAGGPFVLEIGRPTLIRVG